LESKTYPIAVRNAVLASEPMPSDELIYAELAYELALRDELAERAGHARPSMSLDVYSDVMPADEVPSERFAALIVR
jgi:hypothetical protein